MSKDTLKEVDKIKIQADRRLKLEQCIIEKFLKYLSLEIITVVPTL